MNSKSLMIGDWVKSTDFSFQCSSIGAACVRVAYQSRIYNIKENLLHPIPLTEEILALNGWHRTGYGWLENDACKSIHVYYKWDAFKDEDTGRYVDYMTDFGVNGISGFEWVHEFQHYLRLVNHADIADNFRIKEE